MHCCVGTTALERASSQLPVMTHASFSIWLAVVVVLAPLACCAAQASPPLLDLRLSKGHAVRGYGSIRVSSINSDTESVKPDDFFKYAAPFQHRWTNFTLRSAVIDSVPSGASQVVTPLGNFTLRMPEQGSGIRGLIMGDPCFINGSFHPCTCGTRIARLLNAVAPSSDFRALLGDNLYDRDGSKTALMYSMLTPRAKETLQLAVPGNHDFWEAGEELLLKDYDQFGNGFMQVGSVQFIIIIIITVSCRCTLKTWLPLSATPPAPSTFPTTPTAAMWQEATTSFSTTPSATW